jgi:hypothetical protein
MSAPVIAKLGYVGPMAAYPVSATFAPERRSNLVWDRREVAIHDGDEIPGGASLETHGFACVPHETAIGEFGEDYAWAPAYSQELAALIRQMTGASDVVVRALGLGSTKLSGGNGAVEFCHNDYTAASVGRHILELDAERAEDRLSRRFAVFNMWRLVSAPPQSKPLAICDSTSVAISDLVPGMTHWPNADPEEEIYHQNALFRYSPAHRWFYYPRLERDRILVWAGYDSDPRFPSIVPHAAFDNPGCTDPNAYRTAVHGRAYAFFDA